VSDPKFFPPGRSPSLYFSLLPGMACGGDRFAVACVHHHAVAQFRPPIGRPQRPRHFRGLGTAMVRNRGLSTRSSVSAVIFGGQSLALVISFPGADMGAVAETGSHSDGDWFEVRRLRGRCGVAKYWALQRGEDRVRVGAQPARAAGRASATGAATRWVDRSGAPRRRRAAVDPRRRPGPDRAPERPARWSC
jgi:hypothetical protein